MLLHEIFSLFESLDVLLSEGFKDDMFKQYPNDKENPKFIKAINDYNSDPKLKEALKHIVKPQGNIAVSVKKQYPTGTDFVNLINSLIKKAKDRQEYKEIKKDSSDVNEADYWIIPCHTFEELHKAAFMYGGNLPRLNNEEISKQYEIEVPEEGTYYETEDTPEEFLNYMKEEDRFFMAPSWCVAANKEYFDGYKLKTEKTEKPLCYVFISKKYPNVRFCVVFGCGGDSEDLKLVKKDNDVVIKDTIKIREIRDTWQIGGDDKIDCGLGMMKYAFGYKIKNIIDNLLEERDEKILMKTSDIKYGEQFFSHNEHITTIYGDFSNLKNGNDMFSSCKNLTSIESTFPALSESISMFSQCAGLTSINKKLPSLVYGNYMFDGCYNLTNAILDTPILNRAVKMFNDCEKLQSFNGNLNELGYADSMFFNCKNLQSFNANLSKLKNGNFMFYGCSSLKNFEEELPLLNSAWRYV